MSNIKCFRVVESDGTAMYAARYQPGMGRGVPDNLDEEEAMGSTSDKIKGLANEAAGNFKQAAGKAVGNEKLQAEGKAQEIKGEVQQAVGRAKDAVKKGADKLSDATHRKL